MMMTASVDVAGPTNVPLSPGLGGQEINSLSTSATSSSPAVPTLSALAPSTITTSAPPPTNTANVSQAGNDGWDEEEVEESGAIVPAPTSTTSSALNPFGSTSSPLLGQRHLSSPSLHPLLQSPPLAARSASSPLVVKDQPLSYLQIAGALSSSSGHQQSSTSPLVNRGLPFSFVPSTLINGSSGARDADEFKVAFGASRDRLQLFERRLDGTDGTATTDATTSSSSSTPLKKRKVEGEKGGSAKDGKRRKKESKSSKKSKTPKTEEGNDKPLEKPEGGFTFMQGTYYILKREHRFMTAKEIVEIGQKEGLFASSKGKTPEATVAAGIYVDLKKPVSQFCQGCKVGKRGFGLSEWTDLESIPGPPDVPSKKKKKEEAKPKGRRGRKDEAKPKGRPRKRTDEDGNREKLKALDEEEEEEVEEEMVIVEEEEEEEGEIVQPKRPLPFGSPLVL